MAPRCFPMFDYYRNDFIYGRQNRLPKVREARESAGGYRGSFWVKHKLDDPLVESVPLLHSISAGGNNGSFPVGRRENIWHPDGLRTKQSAANPARRQACGNRRRHTRRYPR